MEISKLKKRQFADVEVFAGDFYRRIQNGSSDGDVTGSPFKMPTKLPRDY
jgi:hypothetical protein